MELPPAFPWFSSVLRRRGLFLAVFALGAYALLIARHVNACAGGTDSSGYWNAARLLAAGHIQTPPRFFRACRQARRRRIFTCRSASNRLPSREQIVPIYPMGLPLLFIAAAPVAGWNSAGNWILGLHAVFGLILCYAACRTFGLPPPWSALGAAILAASPLYLCYCLQAMSDVPALVWTCAAVLAAWRGAQGNATDRARLAWCAASGAAFAGAVLIRPSNLIAIVPCALALVPLRRGMEAVRNGFYFALGGSPGAIFFFFHSRLAYGRALTTGYGNMTYNFDALLIGPTLLHYVHWLTILFTPALAFFLALPWVSRSHAKAASVVGSWASVYLIFFATYRFTHVTWWYLRFVLPAVPALIAGSLLAARALVRASGFERLHPFWRRPISAIAFCAAAGFVLANGARWTQKLRVWTIIADEAIYPETAAWLRGHVSPDSVIAAMQESGALFYYTDFTFVRWDQIDAATFRRLTAAAKAARRPLYAALFPFEEQEALQTRMPGPWTQVGSVRSVTLWRYDEI